MLGTVQNRAHKATHVKNFTEYTHTHTRVQANLADLKDPWVNVNILFVILYQFCKMLPLWETGQRVHGIFLHYFLQWYVHLQ